jgi:hypothetical protein
MMDMNMDATQTCTGMYEYIEMHMNKNYQFLKYRTVHS